MIPSLRKQFNSEWSLARFERVLQFLEHRFGEPPPFRISETPCFLPAALVDEAGRYGREIVHQLLDNPEYIEASGSAVPEKYRVPRESPVPLFVQADFGLDENRQLKLVEIQGFPSLYCYQPVLAAGYREGYGLNEQLDSFPPAIDEARYKAILNRAIVGEHDPKNVVLLELDPWRQKTRHDFAATRDLLGVAVVDVRSVIKEGTRLFREENGTRVLVERIYNRVIADELERKAIKLPFRFTDDLDVEWAGHPNWFFRLSKFSLPYLRHPAVPEAHFLDRVKIEELDLHRFVLKPLYSFAGTGVIVGPEKTDLDGIPGAERSNYILQKRVNFQPVIDTPEGPTKVEIRVMYVWDGDMVPVNYVLRMGRGEQMGVDFNKGFGWVGASAAFIQGEHGR